MPTTTTSVGLYVLTVSSSWWYQLKGAAELALGRRGMVTKFHCLCRARDRVWKESDRGYEDAVKWIVHVLNLKTGERTSEVFDAVLLCSG